MIDRFRELRGSHTVKHTARGKPVPTYPEEFYLLWYRTNTVMQQIIEKRGSKEEAPIVPEVNRDIDRLEETFKEEVAQP